MLRFALYAAAALAVATAVSTVAQAQMPTDNDAWTSRCNVLSAHADLAHLTPDLKAITRGVPAGKYMTFAFDRSEAGQPAVACTMFYLGAIAAQDSSDTAGAHDDAVLAEIEIKALHHQNSTFAESLTRLRVKAHEITKPNLTISDEQNVMAAATTIPVSTLAADKPAAFPHSLGD